MACRIIYCHTRRKWQLTGLKSGARCSDYAAQVGAGVGDSIQAVNLADSPMAALNYWANNQAMMTVKLGSGVGYNVLDTGGTLANASNKKYPMK